MRPHPLVGKVIRWSGKDRLVTEAPVCLGNGAVGFQAGTLACFVTASSVRDALIAEPGGEYRPLTLEECQP